MFLQSSTLIGSQVFKLVYKTNKNMYRTHFLLFLFSFLLAKNLQFPQVQHLSIELSAWKMKKKKFVIFFFFYYLITLLQGTVQYTQEIRVIPLALHRTDSLNACINEFVNVPVLNGAR